MPIKINFTKRNIEQLEIPSQKSARTVVYDNKINGLQLRISGAGSKTFSVYKKLHGKPIRVTLGKFPDMTPEQAKKQAQQVLSEIAEGKNPNQEKQNRKTEQVTLQEVFNNLLETRSYKDNTIRDYTQAINTAFADWQNKPLNHITEDKVLTRYKNRAKQAPTRANNEMRVLKLIFNFAKGAYKDKQGKTLFPENPVSVLSHLRVLKPARRKQTIIQIHQFKPWFESVQRYDELIDELKISTIRDYLIFTLLTGLRREEAASLQWENVDLTGKTITIKDTKNHDDFELPLSDYLVEILERRFHQCGDKQYIFPGKGKTGHIINPSKAIARIREETKIHFTMHDLRRTFITAAESLDISTISLKRLINHRSNRNDVTAGYVIANVERLREPMQRITDFILEQAEIKK